MVVELQKRHKRNQPYTWLNRRVLLSVNPGRPLAAVYAATNGTAGFSNPLDPGYTFGVRQEGGNLYVAYEVVPEPSTYALLAVAAVGFGAHLLRRRKRGKVS